MEYVKILHVYIKPLLHVILHNVNILNRYKQFFIQIRIKNFVLSSKTTSLRYQYALCNLINFMCWIEIGLFDAICVRFSALVDFILSNTEDSVSCNISFFFFLRFLPRNRTYLRNPLQNGEESRETRRLPIFAVLFVFVSCWYSGIILESE